MSTPTHTHTHTHSLTHSHSHSRSRHVAASYKVYRILVIFLLAAKKNCCQETNNIDKISLYLFFYILYKLLFKNNYDNNNRTSIYN